MQQRGCRASAVAVSAAVPRHVALLLTACLLAVTGVVLTVATPAGAAANDMEQAFTSRINAARSSAGLSALESRPALVSVAREWARQMASRQRLYHNPRLTQDVPNWRWVGENVGYGPDAQSIHVAFMNSPGHRANILDRDYTEVGVGAVRVDGRVWVAEVFRKPLRAVSRSFQSAGFSGLLRVGSTGSAVKRVQARLGVSVTGRYGVTTKAAVSRFQKSLGWAGRGRVGRHTWARLF